MLAINQEAKDKQRDFLILLTISEANKRCKWRQLEVPSAVLCNHCGLCSHSLIFPEAANHSAQARHNWPLSAIAFTRVSSACRVCTKYSAPLSSPACHSRCSK